VLQTSQSVIATLSSGARDAINNQEEKGKVVWVHVGQQPIVDASGLAVAYEILFRSAADATRAEVRDAEESTAQVLTATFLEFGLPDLVGDRLAFINMPRGFLVGRWPLPFDAGGWCWRSSKTSRPTTR